MKLLLAMAALLIAAGCASVPKAPLSESAAAKSFAPESGRAVIYIYRDEYAFGGSYLLVVSINGQSLGQTLGRTFYRVSVEPGRHEITSFGEDVSKTVVSADAGKVYFVRQEVKMGLMAPRSSVYLVDDETGRRGVMECELAARSEGAPSPLAPGSRDGPPTKSPGELLRELEQLRKDGVITEQEFARKKREVLDRM